MRYFNPEWRRKLSEAAKKRFAAMTPEERKHSMYAANKVSNTPEAIAKANASRSLLPGANTGKKFGPAWRAKLSESFRQAWKAKTPEERKAWGLKHGGSEPGTMSAKGRASVSRAVKARLAAMTPEERRIYYAPVIAAMHSPEAQIKRTKTMNEMASRMTPEERHLKILPALRVANVIQKSKLETKIEELLNALGVEFIFQHPVARYFADFYIPSKNLIIECDGEYWHNKPGAAEHDAKRDAHLRKIGYAIIRFSETEIKKMTSCLLRGRIA